MADNKTTIKDLKQQLEKVVKERNWQQFHSAKNLAMSIGIEAAELMEIFQWTDSEQSAKEVEKNKALIEEELADITAYVLSFCNQYDIDLSSAFERKLELNKKKYPVTDSNKMDKDSIINQYYKQRTDHRSKK